jgi:hypothetical protein
MIDIESGAEFVELVLTCRGALAQTKEPVGELFSIVSQNRADAQRARAL